MWCHRCLCRPGSANVVGGTFAAIKLVGKRIDDMVIKHPVAMKCAFGENPKSNYVKSEIPLKAHAHRIVNLFTSIRIAKEFGVKMPLDHCTECVLIADELAKAGCPAFMGPTFGMAGKNEQMHKSFATAAVIHKAGVPIRTSTS